jgi:hypothetical protein
MRNFRKLAAAVTLAVVMAMASGTLQAANGNANAAHCRNLLRGIAAATALGESGVELLAFLQAQYDAICVAE